MNEPARRVVKMKEIPAHVMGVYRRACLKAYENSRRYNRLLKRVRIPEKPYRFYFMKPEEPNRCEYTMVKNAQHARKAKHYDRSSVRWHDMLQCILPYIDHESMEQTP